ncbi:hypothetical protein WN943_021020 [Citrus x changshan-huyou]
MSQRRRDSASYLVMLGFLEDKRICFVYSRVPSSSLRPSYLAGDRDTWASFVDILYRDYTCGLRVNDGNHPVRCVISDWVVESYQYAKVESSVTLIRRVIGTVAKRANV